MPGPEDPPSAHQVTCPNCRGGNPPVAQRCMWCGAALKPARGAPTASPVPTLAPGADK